MDGDPNDPEHNGVICYKCGGSGHYGYDCNDKNVSLSERLRKHIFNNAMNNALTMFHNSGPASVATVVCFPSPVYTLQQTVLSVVCGTGAITNTNTNYYEKTNGWQSRTWPRRKRQITYDQSTNVGEQPPLPPLPPPPTPPPPPEPKAKRIRIRRGKQANKIANIQEVISTADEQTQVTKANVQPNQPSSEQDRQPQEQQQQNATVGTTAAQFSFAAAANSTPSMPVKFRLQQRQQLSSTITEGKGGVFAVQAQPTYAQVQHGFQQALAWAIGKRKKPPAAGNDQSAPTISQPATFGQFSSIHHPSPAVVHVGGNPTGDSVVVDYQHQRFAALLDLQQKQASCLQQTTATIKAMAGNNDAIAQQQPFSPFINNAPVQQHASASWNSGQGMLIKEEMSEEQRQQFRHPHQQRLTDPRISRPPHPVQQQQRVGHAEQLFKKFPVVWNGNVVVKTDAVLTQMLYVSGALHLTGQLPLCAGNGPLFPELIIKDLMRLDDQSWKSVHLKMQLPQDHCVLVAVTAGTSFTAIGEQERILRTKIVDYLIQKQAAGVVRLFKHGTDRATHSVRLFPPGEFSDYYLSSSAGDLVQCIQKQQMPYLFVVITTSAA